MRVVGRGSSGRGSSGRGSSGGGCLAIGAEPMEPWAQAHGLGRWSWASSITLTFLPIIDSPQPVIAGVLYIYIYIFIHICVYIYIYTCAFIVFLRSLWILNHRGCNKHLGTQGVVLLFGVSRGRVSSCRGNGHTVFFQ